MTERDIRPDVKQFWTARAGFWDTMYETDSSFWRWFNQVFRQGIFARAGLALQTSQETRCQSVLDVGCGSGRVSCLLAENGVPRIVGIDTAPTMVARATELIEQRKLGHICRFVVGDFLSSDLEGPFEGVVALGVFDYLNDPLPFLVKMRKLATKFVVASFPSPTLVRMPLRKVRYALRGCPVFFYRRQRVETLFRNAGFAKFDVHRLTRDGYGVVGWVAPEVNRQHVATPDSAGHRHGSQTARTSP